MDGFFVSLECAVSEYISDHIIFPLFYFGFGKENISSFLFFFESTSTSFSFFLPSLIIYFMSKRCSITVIELL